MASRSTAKSGLWSDTTVWTGGVVPANGDTATITAGHTVTYDVDQSGFAAGLAGLTVNGTLQASTTPGTYVLKMAGNITLGSNGALNVGSSTIPYPADCLFKILLNGQYYMQPGNSNIYCLEPALKYVKLTADAALGATVLSVDGDMSADASWLATGATVAIADAAAPRPDVEERTIQSITSNTITITAGLTSSKAAGSIVCLIYRNVQIIGPNTGTNNYGVNGAGTGNYYRCLVRDCYQGYRGLTGATVDGVIYNCSYGFYFGAGNLCKSAVVNSSVYGVNGYTGYTVSGPIVGCTAGLNGNEIQLVSGAYLACNGSAIFSMGQLISNAAVLENNTQDVNSYLGGSVFYNTKFASTVEMLNYSYIGRAAWNYIESIDHDQVSGAFRAWTRGGITDKVSDVYPAGKSYSYKHACESSGYPCFRQVRYTIQPGDTLAISVLLNKSVSMAVLPKVEILDYYQDPLISAAYQPLASGVMTNSTDTWEDLHIAYMNTIVAPRTVLVRISAQNASGYLYEYVESALVVSNPKPAILLGGVTL